jgi:hypothetical protein
MGALPDRLAKSIDSVCDVDSAGLDQRMVDNVVPDGSR